MGEVIHVAAPAITVGSVKRQRCAWCGALISERDFDRTATEIKPGESEEHAVESMRRSDWQGLVAIEGNVSWSVPEPDDGKVPQRSCMAATPHEEAEHGE